MRFPLFVALPALLLAACTFVPEARVSGIRLERQGADGARVVAMVGLKNETRTPMPMVRVRYRVEVEGETPFVIDDQPFKTVPAVATDAKGQEIVGEQTVELPAGIPAKASLAGRKCAVSGTLYFEPDTDWRRLKTELGIPLPTRDFDGEAVLAAPASPNAAPVAAPAAKP